MKLRLSWQWVHTRRGCSSDT